MNQSSSQAASDANRSSSCFSDRPASTAWEPALLPDYPELGVWIWFKPASAPNSLVITIPDETRRSHPHPEQLTMRTLLSAVGLSPATVAAWSIAGVAYDGMNGTSPLLDAPIPAQAEGVDPSIVVYFAVLPDGMPHFSVADGNTEDVPIADIFERIEADWTACQETLTELAVWRQKLLDMYARLKALNRDLTTDEQLYGNNQDKQDWMLARRYLRDASMRLLNAVKDHDIGDASSAGQRRWFEQTFVNYIMPRREFEGMREAQRGYEAYRKMVMTLQSKMKAAHHHAAQNGERRAQQILNRIAQKIREATNRKNFLGVILDS